MMGIVLYNILEAFDVKRSQSYVKKSQYILVFKMQ